MIPPCSPLPDARKGERAYTPCDPSITENALTPGLRDMLLGYTRVGVARKLAVMLHWLSLEGTVFRPDTEGGAVSA
jgi:hypothetical protein